ncbi:MULTISPECIES: branched-chain amino acid ABC transporter permease [Salinibaculum]|uniref:branched-chain amino acid ABC transporter permease n=1 Tax=Salinibaculum TaxID=2732368 RepID=UPI0030CB7282
MVQVTNLVISALTLSALYALVAIGFTMIFGVGDILNVAHGAAIILGGFAAFYTVSLLDQSIWLGLVFAIVVPAVFSVGVYKVFVKRIEDEIFIVIITLVILLLTENIFLFVEGTSSKVIPDLFPGQTEIAGITLQNNSAFLFLFSWALILGLIVFTNRSWIGRGIQSLSMSERGSNLVGVNTERTTTYTYAIAGGLAGLAGLFFGMSQSVSYNMGLDPLLLAFAIVILGGMGSIKGSVVGAYIIGSLETVTTTLIDARMTGIISLAVMFLVIMIRPHGLFGRPGEE